MRIKDIVTPIKRVLSPVLYWLEMNLYAFGFILEGACPYLMYYLGAALYAERGSFQIGGEAFIPVVIFIFSGVMKVFSNQNGKGLSAPIPKERFTEVNYETGEVSVDTARVQEMLLYVADVEDWLEKTGRM